MGIYAGELAQLQSIFDKVLGKTTDTPNFKITMRIYESLKSNPEFKDSAAELVGRMKLKVSEAIYTEDKEAVEQLADTIVTILLEMYYGIRDYMDIDDARTYLLHAASSVSLEL